MLFLKKLNIYFTKNKFLFVTIVFLLLVGVVFVPKVFAQPQPIKSVEIFSEKLNYAEKEAGSWKVTKSAK